jgi:hypothetical protein
VAQRAVDEGVDARFDDRAGLGGSRERGFDLTAQSEGDRVCDRNPSLCWGGRVVW